MKNMFLNIKKAFWAGLLLPVMLCAYGAKAQNVRDSSLGFPIIGFQYSADVPLFSLAKSFGVNSTIGASFWYKTKSQWLFGAEYNYIFTDQVKINPLDSISTTDGYVINKEGQYSDVFIYERGHFMMLKAGKIFNHLRENPNSGLFVKAGLGYWLHQIYYYWPSEQPVQVSGNYVNGYDRLSGGPALSQSFGYLHFASNKLINFSAELEVAEGFTQNLRAYNFDQQQKDNGHYFDMTIGLKIAWYFPIYNKAESTYVY